MPAYKAPVRDYQFVLWELLNSEAHYQRLGAEDATRDMVDAIIQEAGKFCEEVLSPLNEVGDSQGCTFNNGVVTTPDGFKEAYQQWVESGWPSLAAEEKFGGQGLPESIANIVSEMAGAANWSWAMYPGLSHGAINTLEQHGTDEQQQLYLPKLVSGEWTGTMCLTEPHCGSDLGLLKTKAVPNDDGSYAITGNKIYISAGEHDMADNIVHIVLARLPDAPAGTKGISLFIVPKHLPNESGEVGERNGVVCGSIEEKMGIHGNATAVLNFDDAKGWLIGPPHKGLNCMFTFMNFARIGTAIQGVSATELSFQGALAYAKDRLAMRGLNGPVKPDKPADPIIVHPDVRRMLFTQKAVAEGGRAMLAYASQFVDIVRQGGDDAKEADKLLSVVTPVAKAFLTEMAIETTNHGVQIHGGAGFVKDYGMEQIVRDVRISTIYEGTTAIQSLDLLGRKILGSNGALLKVLAKEIEGSMRVMGQDYAMGEFVAPLAKRMKELETMTQALGMKAMTDRTVVGAAAYDYMMFCGYVLLGWLWARMAQVAHKKLAEGDSEEAFYEAKIKTARFYFERILPRCSAHRYGILGDPDTLTSMHDDNFSF